MLVSVLYEYLQKSKLKSNVLLSTLDCLYQSKISILYSTFQVWDLGYGFTLKQLYRTGYFVMGISTVLAAAISLV